MAEPTPQQVPFYQEQTGGLSVGIDSPVATRKRRLRHRARRRGAVLWGVATLAVSAILTWATLHSFLSVIHIKPSGADAAATPDPVPGQRINILVMGLDKPADGLKTAVDIRQGISRSDVMFIVSIDPETKDVGLLSIPRDTRVNIPGYGMDKINAAHAYGQAEDQPRGPALAMRAVREFLGVDIRYYVRVNVDGFRSIVDLLGGVEMDIPRDMDYDDPTQDLHIHLKQGRQLLNGERAMEYVRYRSYNNADIGRIQAQQEFMKALVRRAFSLGTVHKLPSLLSQLKKLVDTSIDPGTMLSLATMAARFDPDKVQMGTIPGEDKSVSGIDYWIPDMAKTRPLVDRLIRGIDRQANALVKVEILNGTEVSAKGTQLAGRLRAQGYDVTRVARADRADYTYTRITNHGGDNESVTHLVRSVVHWAPQAKSYHRTAGTAGATGTTGTASGVTVTIIIGSDFK